MLFDYGYGPFRWVCLSIKTPETQVQPTMQPWEADQINSSLPGPRQLQLDSCDAERTNWWLVHSSYPLSKIAWAVNIALKIRELIRQKIGPVADRT